MPSLIGKYLTVSETARVLRCSKKRIYQMRLEGCDLAFMSFGPRMLRVSADSLCQFMAKRKIPYEKTAQEFHWDLNAREIE